MKKIIETTSEELLLLSEVEEEVLIHLINLFPNADLGYLNLIIKSQFEWNPPASTCSSTSSTLIKRKVNSSSSFLKGKEKALNQDQNQTTRLERLIERITTKILESNRGHYPVSTYNGRQITSSGSSNKKGESSKAVLKDEKGIESARTMDRNLAMIHLHQIFPTTPISVLRNLLLSLPHSFLFTAVEELLTNPTQSTSSSSSPPPCSYFSSFFSRSNSTLPLAPQITRVLLPSDLFRSQEYLESLVTHLKSVCPLVPLVTIKVIVANGGNYSEIRETVEGWRSKTSRIKVWLSDVFLNGTTSSSGHSTSGTGDGNIQDESELGKEIWEYERPKREAKSREDEILAKKLNSDWTKEESKYECECCFDPEVDFLDVGYCTSGVHAFCRTCIGRQVEEHVFGQAPLRILREVGGEGEGREGEGNGVRCLSTEGCQSPFSHSTLERILTPNLFSALSRRLSESALESLQLNQFNSSNNDETLIRCPFCSYTEIGDGSILRKCFPFLMALRKKNLSLEGLFLFPLLDLFASINLLHLYGLAFIIINFFPSSFSHLAGRLNTATHSPSSLTYKSSPSSPNNNNNNIEDNPTFFPLLEPHRVILVAHRFLTSIARKILMSRNGNRNVFQCRNGPNHLPLESFGAALDDRDRSGERGGIKDFNDLVMKVWPGWKELTLGKRKSKLGEEVSKEEKKHGNPSSEGGTCGRLSCLSCERIYIDGRHICHEDEKEGLRLAVEKAIDLTVKRKCNQCGLSYLKGDGCNKMVCRCGYTSCYTCRKEIKEESYAHFCPHFRSILGATCTQCNLCSLWETPDDKIAIEFAATRAREEWIREHPQTTREALSQRIGHGNLLLQDRLTSNNSVKPTINVRN